MGQLVAARACVGGSADGATAARLATVAVADYIAASFRSYHDAGAGRAGDFLESLRNAAFQAHDRVRAESIAAGHGTMATTLTLGIGVWPWIYVVQVGDSRAYIHTRGALRQITHDQTLAEELIDRGVLKPEDRERSPLTHILSSSIGGDRDSASRRSAAGATAPAHC